MSVDGIMFYGDSKGKRVEDEMGQTLCKLNLKYENGPNCQF